MKRRSAKMTALRRELAYHQTMVLVDLGTLKLGIAKVKEIAKRMRDEQRKMS